MRIAYITAGAGASYCGNCLRDHALARALLDLGEEVTLVPTYTPLRTDLPQERTAPLFYNGLPVYLEQHLPFLQRPRPLLDRLLAAPLWIRLAARAAGTDPARLGDLTVSVLRGEEGYQRKELERLSAWLAREVRPDVVHLTNSLLAGLARRLKEVLQVPVACGLQGEDAFLEALPGDARAQALAAIRERIRECDRLVAVSRHYAAVAAGLIEVPLETITVVPPGIPLAGHEPRPMRPDAEPAVGYLARLAPEKGLDLLCEAFLELARDPSLERLRLRVAGSADRRQLPFLRALRQRLGAAGVGDRVEILGTVNRREKLEFLAGIDVLAVPAVRPEPKGLAVLEALASGVPVVVPGHGVFPEILERAPGGVLTRPGDVADLASRLRELLLDPERRERLAAAGREGVREHFSAERMARETLGIYRELVAAA